MKLLEFFLGFFGDLFFSEYLEENEAEELEPNYVYHMSEDGEVELQPSGNSHSPIE